MTIPWLFLSCLRRSLVAPLLTLASQTGGDRPNVERRDPTGWDAVRSGGEIEAEGCLASYSRPSLPCHYLRPLSPLLTRFRSLRSLSPRVADLPLGGLRPGSATRSEREWTDVVRKASKWRKQWVGMRKERLMATGITWFFISKDFYPR